MDLIFIGLLLLTYNTVHWQWEYNAVVGIYNAILTFEPQNLSGSVLQWKCLVQPH